MQAQLGAVFFWRRLSLGLLLSIIRSYASGPAYIASLIVSGVT